MVAHVTHNWFAGLRLPTLLNHSHSKLLHTLPPQRRPKPSTYLTATGGAL